jgi:Rps23 Pro-64 3,4-dihydroxylase Tpa1-like proline 4-hydroxylase
MNNVPDNIYLNNIKKIGKDVKNIHVIENFLDLEECTKLYKECTENIFKDSMKVNSRFFSKSKFFNNLANDIFETSSIRISKMIKEIYDIDATVSSHKHLVKCVVGSELNEHVDDFATFHHNMSAIIYLNDNYEGGEIHFSDFDLTIKPKFNTLVLFPGNKYYSHKVLKITGGERYTMPIWFKFDGSSFSGLGRGLGFNNVSDWKNIEWENNIEDWK